VGRPVGKPRECRPWDLPSTTPPRLPPTLHGRFYRSQLLPLLRHVNTYLARWARKKYKRLRSLKRFKAWWTGILDRDPGLFRHWTWESHFLWKG